VRRGIALVLLGGVLVVGSAGVVLLPHVESDGICESSASPDEDVSLWPPGHSCGADEEHDRVGFFAVLGAGLALAGAVARSRPAVPAWLRGAVSGALTIGLMGLFVLWIPAFVALWFPAFVALPLAWYVEQRLAPQELGPLRGVRGAVLSGLSFAVLIVALLFGIGLAAPLLAVLAAAGLGELSARVRGLPSPA
jgi:hypothetical protein